MKNSKKYTVILMLVTLLTGCNAIKNDAKVQGKERWQAARASITLARAAEQFGNGDLEGAHASVTQTLELQPELYEARVLMCKILIAQRSYTQALGDLEKLTVNHPADSQLFYLMGAAYEGLGAYERALGQYRKASAISPDDTSCLVSQVECLTVLKRLQEALDLAEKTLIPLSESAAAYQMAGDLAISLERYELAVKYYRRAVSYAPENLTLQHSLAGAFYSCGKYAEAASILEQLVTKRPYNKSAWTSSMLGDCRMAMLRHEQASDAYSRAADLDNNNVAVLVNLAKSSLASEDYPRAVLASRRALRKDGGNLSASMVLAYSLMRQGHNDQAIDELIRCEGSHPDDATLLCLIGKAYEAAGQIQQARQYYNKALDIEAGNRLASSLLAGIDR